MCQLATSVELIYVSVIAAAVSAYCAQIRYVNAQNLDTEAKYNDPGNLFDFVEMHSLGLHGSMLSPFFLYVMSFSVVCGASGFAVIALAISRAAAALNIEQGQNFCREAIHLVMIAFENFCSFV